MSLREFFEAMPPFLLGEVDVAATLGRLGPSESGEEAVAYYRVLMGRNFRKYMREIFPWVRLLLERDQPELWDTLVESYFAAHPPRTRHANELAAEFSSFLARRRAEGLEISALPEELADYTMCQIRATMCPDDVGDGFDRRLFVRQYTYDIPAVIRRLEEDPAADVESEQSSTPRMLAVFRHLQTMQTRLLHPSPFALLAIARRQGLPLPEPFAAQSARVDAAERNLVELGVLVPQ